jgi:hypothetical protein
MKRNKVGRNNPCPCGSGLKYKKCHGRNLADLPKYSGKIDQNLFERLPPSVQREILERESIERRRKALYGQVRPTIALDFQDFKMVAVGNHLHYSKKWKTFHDFLFDYLKKCLGSEWGNAELTKSNSEQHPIVQWYKTLCDFQKRNINQEGEVYSAVCTGPVGAYLSLAYDLYVLRHHSALQERLLNRLRDKQQFQGARYEVFVTASFIKAGLHIAFEDETNGTRSHCEFVAGHKQSGRKYSVEAKSRHRPGHLGQDGDPRANDDIRLRIGKLLRSALQKEAAHTRIIFVDINMPPESRDVTPFQAKWFRGLINEISRVEIDTVGGKPIPPAFLFFTNHPYHYVGEEEPEPRKDFLMTAINMAEWKINSPEAVAKIDPPIFGLWESINEHTSIPSTFDE